MSNGTFNQYRISRNKPFMQTPAIIADIYIDIEKPRPNDSKPFFLKMKMRQRRGQIPILGDDNGRYFINIRGNSKINFHLSENVYWRWSDQYDAITTKSDLSEFYGNLEYDGEMSPENINLAIAIPDIKIPSPENEIELDQDRSIDVMPGYTSISFYAKLHRNGLPGTNHSFCLNIDLRQEGDGWLPITIDPDIKNPPPINPRYLEDVEDDDDTKTASVSLFADL